ncbi:unnamed protein product [Leptosia nina]|uniref:Uncharacterized protein n=1 Tax=Leptosia nina TaxID=320188 RepID=A0AAV1IWM5_9NEOP
MAPSPEYDKEPKAPDKPVVKKSCDDTKVQYNNTKDNISISEHRSTTAPANCDVENKHVETLDDGQLRALLDEAITYKCPKDREGKSSLFKELLEEVEQDEEACEAAALVRRGACGRREHHASLQDLVAAMAAEPAPRRRAQHHASSVSARTHHGGSLPSGVDTSFLLSEEPAGRGGYLATVRCVNPPPLAERRVSASDANAPNDIELVTRRSKAMFPMTYTARATLEIGSGSVGSGRAVTTTTASNQVRTTTPRSIMFRPPIAGPPHKLYTTDNLFNPYSNQNKLMDALCKREETCDSGGNAPMECYKEAETGGQQLPRGSNIPNGSKKSTKDSINQSVDTVSLQLKNSVNKWYESFASYYETNEPTIRDFETQLHIDETAMRGPHGDTYNNVVNKAVDSYRKNNKGTKQKKTSTISKNTNLASNMKSKTENKNRVHLRDNNESDISLRNFYRERANKQLVAPDVAMLVNPRNVRNLTIGTSRSFGDLNAQCCTKEESNIVTSKSPSSNRQFKQIIPSDVTNCKRIKIKKTPKHTTDKSNTEANEVLATKSSSFPSSNELDGSKINIDNSETFHSFPKFNKEIEELPATLENISPITTQNPKVDKVEEISLTIEEILISNSVHEYGNSAQPIVLNDMENDTDKTRISTGDVTPSNEAPNMTDIEEIKRDDKLDEGNKGDILERLIKKLDISETDCNEHVPRSDDVSYLVLQDNLMIQLKSEYDDKPINLADLPNNSYLFVTIPEDLMQSFNTNNESITLTEIENNNNTAETKDNNKPTGKKSKKKKQRKEKQKTNSKNSASVNRVDNSGKDKSTVSPSEPEVDSAIPFSCITTPEVVASCNTTSTTQSMVTVDPKPLQLESCYRAVASLTGGAWHPAGGPSSDAPTAPPDPACVSQKSLDENGNAVHGFSSPVSGSSQHKKPRRKKSSKNETVIKSHQIDGYQGNKDLNEVLRFIESNAEGGRGPKMRAKHKDDADDKGKKRCSERRKDKENKIKRASSLEELSRTKLEDLTDKPAARHWPTAPPAKPERRSWGDDARAALLSDETELTDFQTVTKRRKARRRTDEHDPSGDARTPRTLPSRRLSPSERSNDSNDDMDSVHSLPADAPQSRSKTTPSAATPAAPLPPTSAAVHASYADIARTRHNIPDLIESCNFYSEGESELKDQEVPKAQAAALTTESMEGYPALNARKPRDKPIQSLVRSQRKERAEPRAMEPAPDVVGDRRPPVILLDSAARPGDMDGVTFGFDINEQLLTGGVRRVRCDLLRDAPEEGVTVLAGYTALRFVPPPPPRDPTHLHQIIDYVGSAWEDTVRCESGKVRYFSE